MTGAMIPVVPREWGQSEQLEGLDLTDKSELVDMPLRLTGVNYAANDNGVIFVHVDAQTAEGSEVTFSDSSSTGIRHQISTVLVLKGYDVDKLIETGDYVELDLVAPRGLRVSEYDARDNYGKPIRAKSFYLTTSGRRKRNIATPPVKTPVKTQQTKA